MVLAVSTNSGDVVSFLHHVGERYKEHKDLLRRRQLEEERRKCPFKPTVTEYAENMGRLSTARRSAAVEKRLHALHAKRLRAKEAQRAESRERREAQRAAEMRGPRLTALAQSLDQRDPVSVSREWLERREAKLTRLREEALRRDLAALRETPCISQYAREKVIAERHRGQRIEDYFMAKEEARRRRMYWMAEQSVGVNSSFGSSSFSSCGGNNLEQRQPSEERALFNPRITEYAKRLHRSGNVVDRLLAKEAKGPQTPHDESCTFAPRVDPTSSGIFRNFYRDPSATVYERLYRNDAWKMRESRQKKNDMGLEKELTGIPRINETSRLIIERKRAEETEGPLEQSPTNRLYASTGAMNRSAKKKFCSSGGNRSEDEEVCTFRPHINAASEKMWKRQLKLLQEDGYARTAEEARELLRLRSQRRMEEEVQRRREMEAEKEMAECTFHPRVGRLPERRVNSSISVLERNEQWQLQRERRLRDVRRELERTQLSECSFHPMVDPTFPLPARDASSVAGYEAHVLRQEESRRRKQEARDWWRPKAQTGAHSVRRSVSRCAPRQRRHSAGPYSPEFSKSRHGSVSSEDFTEFVVCQAPSRATHASPRSLSASPWQERQHCHYYRGSEDRKSNIGAVMESVKPSPVDFIISHHRAIVESAQRC